MSHAYGMALLNSAAGMREQLRNLTAILNTMKVCAENEGNQEGLFLVNLSLDECQKMSDIVAGLDEITTSINREEVAELQKKVK